MCVIVAPEDIKRLKPYHKDLSLKPHVTSLLRIKVFLIVILVAGNTHEGRASESEAALAPQEPVRQAPRFTVPDTLVVPSGSFSLKWTSPHLSGSPRFELQQGMGRDFSSKRIIYAGPDQRTYISGLPNGDFFYRVRAVDVPQPHKGQWSPVVRRTVQHPSLGFALSFLSVGATVFISIIGVITMGIYGKRTR
jgi:hypothetical protein